MKRKFTVRLKGTPWCVELEHTTTKRSSMFDRPQYKYDFLDGDTVIFDGNEFFPSIGCVDEVDIAMELFDWVALTADNDSELFEDYTPAQIDWRDKYAQELEVWCRDWEEQPDSCMPMTAYYDVNDTYVVEYTD